MERKQQKKIKNKSKGITLIALVVTIVILLILAAVSINLVLGPNGLISRAQEAALKTEESQTKEESDLDYMGKYIDRTVNGNNGLDTVTGEENTNSIVYDKYGNKVIVPAGFKIINPEDDVTKGIIIEDVTANGENSTTIGSQFVWIPVGKVYIDENNNFKNIILGRYTFDENGKETLRQNADNYIEQISIEDEEDTECNYTELLKEVSTDNEKATDIADFVIKVKDNGGYYIGRYEAGDASATEYPRTGTDSVSNPNNPIVCKNGVYPYNYINQSDASNLCKEMYSNGKFKSDIINSYAWDTAIIFIQTFSEDSNYSRQIRLQTSLTKCGEATDGTENDVRCNIYDMAGNLLEWSTETSTDGCSRYGGYFNDNRFYASDRGGSLTTTSNIGISTRPIIYF